MSFTQSTKNIWFPDQVEPVYDSNDFVSQYQFKEYWKNEKDRCINGFYLADGKVKIPGRLYFHTVYGKIAAYKEKAVGSETRKIREIITPILRDLDWDIFQDIEKCIKQGKFYPLVGSRDFGKSVIAASLAAHQYTFFPKSEAVISGGESSYIKLATDKIEDVLLNIHPVFKKQRITSDWKKEIVAGWKDKKTNLPDPKSSLSSIKVRNYENGSKTMAANGTRPGFHLIDEIGTIPNLIGCVKDSDGCWWSGEGDKPSCLVMLAGTGGDMEKGAEAGEIFFNPDPYNMLSFDNPEVIGGKMGRFISALLAKMAFKEPKTLAEYLGIDHPDLQAITILVSNEERAKKEWWDVEHEKAIKSGNPKTLLKFKAYWPLVPSDCFLVLTQNDFNVEQAAKQKAKVIGSGFTGTPISIHYDGDGIYHEFTDKLPISEFPVKTQSKDAPPVIYEFPPSKIPHGLYVAGCLLPGEKVLTDNGLMNIEDIGFNRKLINKDGKLVDIITLLRYDKTNEDIFTLKMSNTVRTTSFTKEHPIYFSNHFTTARMTDEKKFKFDFVKVSDISVGGWIKVPNIYKNINDFDIDDLWIDYTTRIDKRIKSPLKDSDFWWFVGLFLGDGWCESNSYKIVICFNKNEPYYIERYRNIVKRLFDRSVVMEKDKTSCVELSFSCKQLSLFITKHFGKYAYGKYLSDWSKRIDDNLKLQLILGYLNSDGCIYKDKKRGYYSTEFVSISLKLLEDIQDILFSLGIVSSMTILRKGSLRLFENMKKVSKCVETYHLRIGHNDTISLRNSLSDSVSNCHKLQKIDIDNIVKTVASPKSGCFISKCENYIYFRVKKIDKSKYTGTVYNFECKTNTFMCHHITTHNCDPYRQDESQYSDSLGSVYIFKRVHNITDEKFQNMFVASYCARPNRINIWNDNARHLIKMYNATALVENDEMSFINYMIQKKDERYLQETPDWLKAYQAKSSTYGRTYGISTTPNKIRTFLLNNFKTYLDDPLLIEKNELGEIIREILGVSTILDPMLLEEIIKFNKTGNFDRIIAASLAVAQAGKMDSHFIVSSIDNDKRYERYKAKQKKISNILTADRGSSITNFNRGPKLFK